MRTIALTTQAWVSFVFAGSLLSLASPTAAQSCETDTDCGAGYVCHLERYEGCSGMTCKPDEMCPPPTCETYESKYCVSAPCSADADCPGGMVCYAPTYQECSGGGAMTPPCDPGAGGCDVAEPVDAGSFECHDVTGAATCTPRYQLPCSVAADCGAGFACEEQIYTVCSASGMGGAPAMRPDVAPPVSGTAGSGVAGGAAVDAGKDDSFECHEENSGTFYCRLLELPCESDADCGDGLECQNNPYVPGCSSGGSTGTAGSVGMDGAPAMMAAAGSSADDGSVAADAGTPSCGPGSVAPKVCAPHNYYASGGMYPGGGTDGSGNSSGGGTSADGGVNQPPTMSGMGGSTGSGSAGAGNPTSGEGDSAGHGHDHHSAHHHHQAGHLPNLGCSVSGGDAGSQLASFCGLVGLVAFGLRRRTQRG